MAEKSLTFNLFGHDVSASKAVGEFQAKASSHIGSLVKNLAGLGLAYFGVTSAIDFGKKSVEAAQAAETANVKLGVALENTHSKLKVNSDAITKAKQHLSDYGFTGAQTADALAIMTTGLGSSSKALDRLQVVADLAKYKNIGLSEAALIVTKGLEGQLRPLKALGIDMPVYAGNAQQVALANKKVATEQGKLNDLLAKYPGAASTASKHHAAYEAAVKRVAAAQQVANEKAASGTTIVNTLSRKLSGEASKAAETYAGKWAAVSAKWDEIQVKVGTVLIPALSGLADFLSKRLIPGLDETGKHFDAIFKKGQTDAQQTKAIGDGLGQFWKPWAHGLTQVGDYFTGTFVPAMGHGWNQITGFFNSWAKNSLAKTSQWGNQTVAKTNQSMAQLGAAFQHGWSQIQQGFAHGWSQIMGGFGHGWSQIIGAFARGWSQIQGFFSGHPLQAPVFIQWQNITPPGLAGSRAPAPRAFASGGIVPPRPGGTRIDGRFAEAGQPEVIAPLDDLKAMLPKGGIGAGLTVNLHLTGQFFGTAREFQKAVYTALVDGQKLGTIPRNAFS